MVSVEHSIADLLATSLMVDKAVSAMDGGAKKEDPCCSGLLLHCRLCSSWTVGWAANLTADHGGLAANLTAGSVGWAAILTADVARWATIGWDDLGWASLGWDDFEWETSEGKG